MRIGSMGLMDIFPFIKWDMIFDLILLSMPIPIYMSPSSLPAIGISTQSTLGVASTCTFMDILLLGTLT
jgi:hypothetical protein